MTNEQLLKQAAKAYRAHTGFDPTHYRQSKGATLPERVAALKQDIHWFRDAADEAMRMTELPLYKIDLEPNSPVT